ncbi:phosphatidate cytidylyltransferase [Ancylobacter tetraedralis]|uniref:phosphatidate cytidylyltransferase n=1 Tax=Ancylobacter tetraedralis TaxID=217068 RepID=UPI0016066A92|nr:phosphatidate cytidylyltransferase [Ancylobacter tetraedralis]
MRIGADFLPRLGSAVALAPLVLFLCWWGSWPYMALVVATSLIVLWEWLGIISARPKAALVAIGGAALVLASLMLVIRPVSAAAAVVLVGMVLMALVARGGRQLRPWATGGLFYAAALALPALILRADTHVGLVTLIWLLAVVWSTDIAAYFCGRLLRGPKLWPRVSPNKTWSGALGGALFGTLAGMFTIYLAGLPSVLLAAPVALLASAVSQLGDLFESSMKRRFGVKDSGSLIPGHGGLMDRLDGLITAALFALLVGLVRDPDAPALGLLLW